MYQYKAKVIDVYDGDTITAMVDLGFYHFQQMKFRLYGIDTPEIRGESDFGFILMRFPPSRKSFDVAFIFYIFRIKLAGYLLYHFFFYIKPNFCFQMMRFPPSREFYICFTSSGKS